MCYVCRARIDLDNWIVRLAVVVRGGRLLKIAATDICQIATKREGGRRRRPMAQRRTVQITACLLMLQHKNFLNYNPYLKLLAFVFPLKILEPILCLLMVPHVELVPKLDGINHKYVLPKY